LCRGGIPGNWTAGIDALRRTILFAAGFICVWLRAFGVQASRKMPPSNRLQPDSFALDVSDHGIARLRRFDRSMLPKARLPELRFLAGPRIADMRRESLSTVTYGNVNQNA
jgi:hypothetical protein